MAFSGIYAKATIPDAATQLVDFPIPIDGDNFDSSWWAASDTDDQTKGRASLNGVTEIPIHFIEFNRGSSSAKIRVKVTVETTVNDELRIYPPKASNPSYGVSDTYGQYAVYKNTIEGYYPKGGGTDSTSNQLTLTATGSITEGDTTSLFGEATIYSGSSYYSALAPITAQPWSMMALVNHAEAAIDGVMSLADSSATNQQMGVNIASSNASMMINWSGGSFADGTAYILGNTVPISTWSHISGRNSGNSSLNISVNGSTSSGSVTDGAPSGIDTFGLGATVDSTALIFNGAISEAFLFSENVGSDWESYESSAITDNGTFWGTWTTETPSVTASPVNLLLSSIILEQTTASEDLNVIPDDIIMAPIELSQPSASQKFIVNPQDLTLSSIVLDEATIIQPAVPDDLVLSAIILGQTQQGGSYIQKMSFTSGFQSVIQLEGKI